MSDAWGWPLLRGLLGQKGRKKWHYGIRSSFVCSNSWSVVEEGGHMCQRAEDHRLEPDMDTGTLGQWRKHFGHIQGLQETLSISVNYINLIGMIWIKGYIMLYSML